jgi:putative DNA primase/helicase
MSALDDALGDLDDNILPPPTDPMAVARELVARQHTHEQGDLLLRRWRGQWWEWDTTRWVERDDKRIVAAMYAFTEHTAYWIKNKDGKAELKRWAPNRYKVADLADALGAIGYLHENIRTPEWLASAKRLPPARELVALENGLLHVQTRKLYRHDPALFNIVGVPFDYAPRAAQPKQWLKFLAALWDDDTDAIDALQEFFGYLIAGDTRQHKILLIVGPRRGGKGTIARVVKELLGEGNYCGPTLASLGTNFGLQPLIGKPLAIVSDARLGGANVHQVVERLLSISGEDMLTIDRKYHAHWTGTLPTRFIIISNELPRFGDASGAISSRFVLLTLTKSWLGKENTKLTSELLPELPGILNWALDGLERLQEQGRFTIVQSSEDALGALQDLVSPVAAFVRECCEIGAFQVAVDTLYGRWKTWAEENGHKVTSAQVFGRDLRAVVPALRVIRPRKDDTRHREYQGIRLAT